MKIKRVEHIAIAVNSLNQSLDMLRDTFGIPLEYEEQIGAHRLAMLPVGETYIELLESKAPDSGVNQWIAEKGEGLFHICFEVEDIDRRIAELKAKGVKLRDETPAHRPWRRAHCVHRSRFHRQCADRIGGVVSRAQIRPFIAGLVPAIPRGRLPPMMPGREGEKGGMTGFIHPEYLVETDWLAQHLDDPNVLVFDCTTHLIPDPKNHLPGETGTRGTSNRTHPRRAIRRYAARRLRHLDSACGLCASRRKPIRRRDAPLRCQQRDAHRDL